MWSYSPGLADYAVRTMRERGIVGNGATPTLGDLDPQRVARMIEILTPDLRRAERPGAARPDRPTSWCTNEFVDPTIGLPARLTAQFRVPAGSHLEDHRRRRRRRW